VISDIDTNLLIENIDKLYLGFPICMALTLDGILYEWDINDNNPIERLRDVKEAIQPDHVGVYDKWHGFAIKNDNTLWGWGANNNAQLGDGSRINRGEPVIIADNVQKTIKLTSNSGAYLSINGDVYCWGYNNEKPVPIYMGVEETYHSDLYTVLHFNSGNVLAGQLFSDGFKISYNMGDEEYTYALDNVNRIVYIDLVRHIEQPNTTITIINPYFETTNGLWYEEDIKWSSSVNLIEGGIRLP
jgi:hypothetical protein